MRILILLILVSGCTANIIDYDAEKIEREQVNKIKTAQKDPFNNKITPAYVKIADVDDVYIEAIKLKPEINKDELKLDLWAIQAVNITLIPKCVAINWKLQDFDFETGLEYEFLIKPNQLLKVGRMKQSIWSFDGSNITIPPSGYIESMNIRDAKYEKTINQFVCTELESDIQTPKEEYN